MAFAAPTGPVIDEPLRPRAFWFWIGGGLIAIAAIGAGAWLATGIIGLDNTVDDFERVTYPDGGTITIDEPGEYVIYAEGFGGDVGAIGAVLVDPDGDEVVTDVYSGSLTYDFGGRAGSASETFTADQAGDYELSSTSVDSTSVSSLAVGKSIAGDLVSAILGAFAIGGLGVIAGGVILIVTGIRRSRAKKARYPPTTPSPPQGWGQAPATWGPQPQQPQAGWAEPPATESGPGPAAPPPPPTGSSPPPPPGWPT